MKCPRCGDGGYTPAHKCRKCQFHGDPAAVAALDHVNWLLAELETWGAQETPADVRARYTARRASLEVELGLREPLFTAAEAPAAWTRLRRLEKLRPQVEAWRASAYLNEAVIFEWEQRLRQAIAEVRARLAGHTPPVAPLTVEERRGDVEYILATLDMLEQQNVFLHDGAARARAPLAAELAALGGLPAPEARPAAPQSAAPQSVAPQSVAPRPAPRSMTPVAPARPPAVAAPAAPAMPIGERIWRTLVSERTLNAVLFLGIFLLLAAAISFVVWGWQSFPPFVRVAIPTGFTGLFFALGWGIRARTSLRNSGVALSAVAALFIPVDFYTFYVNFHVPPEAMAEFWLLTSGVCLAAYTFAALRIQSRVFGYLVAAAAGSVVLSSMETAGLSRDSWPAGLAATAAALIVLAGQLERLKAARWRVLAEPFRYVALAAVGVLMPLTLAWRYIDRAAYDALHDALALTWWLGGFVLGWGAVRYRSRSLGHAAAIALPVAVYLAQAAWFSRAGINAAWHAAGWALLVNIYFVAGYRFAQSDDAVIQAHGRTANRWGTALLLTAALWSLTDLASGAAAAASHALLVGALGLSAWLWQRPRTLYLASLLSVTATTFAMSEAGLPLAQVCVGWASLALVHIALAAWLGGRERLALFAGPLATAGYVIAAAALLPALFPYDGELAFYTLGHWIALAGWGVVLAHAGARGFTRRLMLFHWLAALPTPFWVWILFEQGDVPALALTLALATLAWGLVALSYTLRRADPAYRWPWRLTGLAVGLAAPLAAAVAVPHGFAPGLCLLAAGLLYFADAAVNQIIRQDSLDLQDKQSLIARLLVRLRLRASALLLPAAGVLTLWGVYLIAAWTRRWEEVLYFIEAAVIAGYFLAGLACEARRSRLFDRAFWRPLYLTAQALTLLPLAGVYLLPLRVYWTDSMQVWGAATQVLLGGVYALYAWSTTRERWAHAGIWLGTAGAGFFFFAYSQGRGSSAVKAALLAAALVLAERGLLALRTWPRASRRAWAYARRVRAYARLAWPLYRRPLLAAGWTVSAATIGLALIRNLWLLGGGRSRELWAIGGLWLIVALYALSARLFRRARFVWLAALLSLAPWTLLTHLGWFFGHAPAATPRYAFAWTVLAWLLLFLGRGVQRFAPRAYALPLRVTAHLFLPFALLWGVAHPAVSRYTYGLAVAFYALEAWRDYRLTWTSALKASRFLYPMLGLLPVWCVYLLRMALPAARHEHYGLLLLAFGPLGLAAGQALERRAPPGRCAPPGLRARTYALPAYLTAYLSLIVGTLLTGHITALLALAFLFDALLLALSAWLFREALWVYPAAAFAPVALLLALQQSALPGDRHGWALLGLAALYLALAQALRRARLREYGAGVLAVGFTLIALALPPSSRDQTGALWGYGAAALLYAVSAFWLAQPVLLIPACALLLVPYAIVLDRHFLVEYHGLLLFPGALAALAAGVLLDARRGAVHDFPWRAPARWLAALAERCLAWWALPLYALGLGLATAAPLFADFRPGFMALYFFILAGFYGWALARFRLRGWLLALGAALHFGAAFVVDWRGWWPWPDWAWLYLLPLTVGTAAAGLWIERRRGEGSPLARGRFFAGWSRPLYALAAADVLVSQAWMLAYATEAGALVTLANALLLAALAAFWDAPALPYGGALLGAIALGQWLTGRELPAEAFPTAYAQLAFGYGALGYGLTLLKRWRSQLRLPHWTRGFERPMQWAALATSGAAVLLGLYTGVDIIGWTLRALVGIPFRELVALPTVWMAVGVLAWLGLLYVAAAAVYRRTRLGYGAAALLLAAWMLFAFYVQRWEGLRGVQWYAFPAGLYLIGVSYLEWRDGRKFAARWVDYAALALMLGSLFWQTLVFGWHYAVMLVAEGLTLLWFGSARRLRRFFYAGMLGVMLATVGQLINALQSVNQWIVFGSIGLLLVALAALIERRLEQIKAALQEVFEDWE